MKNSRLHVSSLLCGALALGCVIDNVGNDTQTVTTSTTSGDQSGSVTGAPASATDGTAGDSTPTMGTATTTASATATDGDSTGEACSFLNCDDMMTDPGECDSFTQDCPEGQKCAAWADDGSNSWNALKCVEVTGTDKPGEACTADLNGLSGKDSCIEGAMCWNWNEEGVGTCLALCSGTAEAPICDPSSLCSIGGDSVLALCIPICDPLLQDCPGGDLCIPNGDNFVCVLDAGGEEGQVNDPCEFVNVCDPGLMCLDSASVGAGCDPTVGGCCSPFCKFPGGACPNPDQSCVQWFDPMQLPENDPQLDIGVCAVPT